MRTSYEENGYGLLFQALAFINKPRLIVECGILDGYSLKSFVQWRTDSRVRVVGIDLFDDYEFKHGKQEEIETFFSVYDNVEIWKDDAFSAMNRFENESIDLLHIDISNDGKNLVTMFDLWTPKVRRGGMIVFEGGSEDRDEIEWMKKYEKTPIRCFKEGLAERAFEFVTFTAHPSLTLCRKV